MSFSAIKVEGSALRSSMKEMVRFSCKGAVLNFWFQGEAQAFLCVVDLLVTMFILYLFIPPMQTHFVLHRASSGNHDRKSARMKMDNASPADYTGLNSECKDGLWQQLQREAFEIVWSKIENTFKAVLKNINGDAFNEIHSWVLESFQAIRSLGSISSSFEAIRPFPIAIDAASKCLHAGLVLTRNIEFVDDLMTFEDLAENLRSRGCHVANLSSLEFSYDNGTSGCIRSLLRQFLSSPVDAVDMSILSSWYFAQGNRDAPVVVILNDLERCCGHVLSDFIIMLSEWIVKIPVILIIGVATTLDVPGEMLHFNALQCLRMCKFILQSPMERMNAVVEAVLVKNCSGFSISHKVAVFLKNYFTNHDGTLSSLIRALKIACAQHFSTEPLSCMLKVFDEQESFHGEKCGFLHEVISACDRAILSSMGKMDEEGIQDMVSTLIELKKMQDRWSVVVLCLYEAAKCRQVNLLDLLCEALDPDLLSSGRIGCHKTSIKGRAMYCAIQNVRELPEVMVVNLVKSWEKHAIAIPEIHGKVKDLQYNLKFENGRRRKEDLPVIKRTNQNHLNALGGSRAFNETAANFLECLINDFMQPLECMPSHEIVCYKNVEKLKAALAGDPRRQIQVDLLGSCRILQCSCCSGDGGTLRPSMQDTSIMYILSQEHGDLINLYDWYQCFKLILQPLGKVNQKTKQNQGKKDNNEDEELSEVAIQSRGSCGCKAKGDRIICSGWHMDSDKVMTSPVTLGDFSTD
ncbi:hypothetical protein SAY87_012720 [Trapa incisa]|uniref:Origin of replication complex subunit 3 n=1 Tax=Trapa incisa TaxID=236973 RepID=A0AAN7JKE3_9MYRT|nr:hypothetical protein SAY87_012720 [Trapa incisa]